MGNVADLADLIRQTEHVGASEMQASGAALSNAKPPFESLPEHVQNMIMALKDVPPYEQLALLHDTTLYLVKYREECGPDSVKSVADILKAGTGDCDDQVIAERALIEYANEQGVANLPVRIVAANVTYSYAQENGQTQSQTVGHNFIISNADGDDVILDPTSRSPLGISDEGDVRMFMTKDLNGADGVADVTFNSVAAVYNSDGSAEINPDMVASAAPEIACAAPAQSVRLMSMGMGQ